MTRIKTKLKDQQLSLKTKPIIAAGDVNTDSFTVELSPEWEQLGEVSYYVEFFRHNHSDGVSVLLDENRSCIIPAAALTTAGKLNFAIYAKNGAETTVKTSTVASVYILTGAYTGAPVYIDWAAWKAELIEALNEKFGAELADDAANEDIISAINALKNADEVKSFFISVLNSAASVFGEDISLTQLDSSMTDAQLTAAIENNYSALANVVSWYLSMQSEVIETLGYLDTESEFGFGIDYDSTQTAREVKNLVAVLVNKYSELADGIIGVFPDDGEFGTDPVPNIIAAVSALVTQKDEIINGMYSLYTGGNDNA